MLGLKLVHFCKRAPGYKKTQQDGWWWSGAYSCIVRRSIVSQIMFSHLWKWNYDKIQMGAELGHGYHDHYNGVIMSAMTSQITSLTIVYSTIYSGADQRKHQSSTPLAFVRGIHRWPVNSPHKGPVTRRIFPFDDVIMIMRPRLPADTVLSTDYNFWRVFKVPWVKILQSGACSMYDFLKFKLGGNLVLFSSTE